MEEAVAALAHDLDPSDDMHASGEVKLHLAGVCCGASRRQLMERHEALHDISLTVNGESRARNRRAAQDAGRFPARGSWAHRQPCRLRAWRVRGLHRARGRRCRARLPRCSPCNATAPASRRSRAFRIPARSPICKRRSSSATRLQCGYCTPGMLLDGAGTARGRRRARAARKSASIFPAITAAAPAMRPSSMRSRRS